MTQDFAEQGRKAPRDVAAALRRGCAAKRQRRRIVVLNLLMAGYMGYAQLGAAQAESLASALARAYAHNPDLNQQRSGLRAQDEEAPKAMAGMRPKANISASYGPQYSNIKIPGGRDQNTGKRVFSYDDYLGQPRGATLSISQSLFDGGRTDGAVRQAESNVFAGRASLRQGEQSILQNGAQVSQQYDSFLGSPGTRQFSAAAVGSLNIPLYQGGSEYASIRQAKELLGRARLTADLQRDNVRATVISAYAQLEAARASIISTQAATKAAETALAGVREEAKVGQRTTLDVLNAQQALLNSRVNLVIAQRDRVVASYAALAAIGRLTARDLNLDVAVYDPGVHYESVKNQWFGLDGSDGR